jgi:hypothetical protein
MEGSLKMTSKFVVFLVAIVMGLMGSAYGTRLGGAAVDYVPYPACYWQCPFVKHCCPPPSRPLTRAS